MDERESLLGQRIRIDPNERDNARAYLSDKARRRFTTDDIFTMIDDDRGSTPDAFGCRTLTAVAADGREISGNAARFLLLVPEPDGTIIERKLAAVYPGKAPRRVMKVWLYRELSTGIPARAQQLLH